MDSNSIHIFLEKILANEKCPKCHADIKVNNIHIQSLTDKSCFFKIHCPKCNFDSLAQAVINISPDKNTENTIKKITKTDISEMEVAKLSAEMEINDYKNLSSFFKFR